MLKIAEAQKITHAKITTFTVSCSKQETTIWADPVEWLLKNNV